jgi:GH43 family beta-xylosidase
LHLEHYYKNPLSINGIGDPFILKASTGKYYCYPTSGANEGFRAWSSYNLVDWKEEGFVYRIEENSWGQNRFWAPEVVEYKGKYYMYYTAGWKLNNSLRIGVAAADNPLGPFKDLKDSPMFDFGYAAIDAHILIDEDGKKYIYFSKDCSENIIDGRHESHIYGAALDNDMVSLKGEPVLLTKPEQDWELKSGTEWRWNEGAFVVKKDGIYYLMYSANFYKERDYSVGYAFSDKPLGPFIKYQNNPVMATQCGEISGPGHHCVTTSPDGSELFIVYHTHTNPQEGGSNRQVCIDRMGFREDGSIYVKGPTADEQPMPSYKK